MKNILYLFIFFSLSCFAAKEEITSSFQSGPPNPNTPFVIGNQVVVEDNWNSFMTMFPLTYVNTFKIKDNKAIVRLRYDDSKKFDPNYSWTLTVSYHTEFTDILGNITTTPPGAYTLAINYLKHSSPTNYTDIALNTHANANSYKVRVIIDNISFITSTSLNLNTIPVAFEDVYLDVTESTERYYVIGSTPPLVTTQIVFSTFPSTGDSDVRLPLAWTYAQGAESYDLEWLYIDVGDNHFSPLSGYNFDFRNATRVNTLNNHYEIPLAYSAGIILYRVRAIGYDLVSGNLIRQEGSWSFYSSGIGNTASIPISADKRFDYAGLDPDKNWVYKSFFSEEAKRKESIVYSDGAFKERQVTAYSPQADNVVISEPRYDYEGRLALDIIPTPTASSGMKYYSFNPNYDPLNFDQNINLNNPDPFPSATNGAGFFYSANNTGAPGMYDDYIPAALDFPFTRTRYKSDGSNRIKSQTHYGVDHKSGSGHEVQYVYAQPTNERELDRLFGNEVGFHNNYFKTGKIDENGQSHVTYLDNHGRVIATCLAGDAPTNLLDIDNKPPVFPIKVDILANGANNTLANSNTQLVSSQLLAVLATTTYHFDYNLDPSTFCKKCINPCEDCVYDIFIQITDEYGNVVSSTNFSNFVSTPAPVASPNPISFVAVNQGNVSFDVTLLPGTYAVDKILSVNNALAAASQYTTNQLLNPTCIDYPLILPESCNDNCHSACEERYTRFNFASSIPYYVDDNEVPISVAQATILIQNCEAQCENPQLSQNQDYCTLQLLALKKDMSPGGQYFSNTMDKYINTTNGVIQDPAYPVHEFDWLLTNLASQSTNIFAQLSIIAGVTISSWQDVKNNWQEDFLNVLIKFHPEYCAYTYFCEGKILCQAAGNQKPDTIKVYESNSFDFNLSFTNQADAILHGYFNTINYPVNTAHSPGDFTSGNMTYNPYSASTNVSDKDPFVKVGCDVDLENCSISPELYMKEYLTKYLHIGGGNYFSIWYVLDDPDNIHLIPIAGLGTPPQATIDFFVALHGDGTTANPGLFASMSKWEFFRSAYLFYKQLFIYRHYTAWGRCPLPSIHNPLFPAPTSVSITHDQPTIHFPSNSIFDQIIQSSAPNGICTVISGSQSLVNNLTTFVDNSVDNVCATNCAEAANDWMAQLSSCGLTSTQEADIRFYLIEVCKKECNSTNVFGTSGCDINVNVNCQAVLGPGSVPFYNFTDVINYFTSSSCNVNIVYPANFATSCPCANLTNFISDNNLTTSNPAAIAAALNSTFFNVNYTATDVTNWLTICSQLNATINDLTTANYPSSFFCTVNVPTYDEINCSCTKINDFINQIGYNAFVPADVPFIVAAINNYFGLTGAQQIDASQLNNIISNCNTGNIPNYTFFQSNNIPPILLCPIPNGTTEEDLIAAQELADCQNQNLMAATSIAVQDLNNLLAIEELVFENEYTLKCLMNAKGTQTPNVPGLETFTETYNLNEYMYTLYFYDQAGNLVKTIPPEGVELITLDADFQAVVDYRNGVTTTPFYPAHRMVSRYSYDSYENKLDGETPDAGTMKYWYDNKGRIVLSQSPTQALTTPPSYSQTKYDLLGRIFSTRQIFNPALALTYDDATDPFDLLTWLNSVNDENQIVKIYYDEVGLTLSPNPFGVAGQKNLRNRISHVTYQENNSPMHSTTQYDYGIHYSYDIHGVPNVISHENAYVDGSNNLLFAADRFHTTENEYDLISGNILRSSYEKGKIDALYHSYTYDANNRLAAVYSSYDDMIWENDAKYFYYSHGPLARKELGDKHIQGCDYAYTINGWLKAMNSSILNVGKDIGKDGTIAPTINTHFANDAFGFANGYFKNDYSSKQPSVLLAANHFEANPFSTTNDYGNFIYDTGSNPRDYGLYNGSMAYGAQNSQITGGTEMGVYGRVYLYDQSYRLKFHETFRDALVGVNNFWSPGTLNNQTREEFIYDYNGNIDNVFRDVLGTPMDFLKYDYLFAGGFKVNNQLLAINDVAAYTPNFTDDIDDQTPNNYAYNDNGELEADLKEGIGFIEYNIGGKIKRIKRPANYFTQDGFGNYFYPSDMEYLYDPLGRRVVKIEKPWFAPNILFPQVTQLTNPIEWKYTIYSYDGGGAVTAIYRYEKNSSNVMELKVTERYVYGEDRVTQSNKEALMTAVPSATHAERELGLKTFELSATSDNINTTVLDYRTSGFTFLNNVLFYKPQVMSAIDYFAHGAPIPGRKFVAETYRYGRNGGSEKDEEIMRLDNLYTTYYRELDTRSARWWSPDPVMNASESPYVANNNNPINIVDPLGDFGKNPLYKEGFSEDQKIKPLFRFRKDGEGGWSASFGIAKQFDWFTPSLNLTLRKYKGTLGSSGATDTRYDFVITPAVAFGLGQGAATEQNLFNSYSLFAVDNNYGYSVVHGVNFVIGKDRTQVVGAYMLRLHQLNAVMYNDSKIFLLGLADDDRWWTGGGRLEWNFKGGRKDEWGTVAVGTEVFTAERKLKDATKKKESERYYTTPGPGGYPVYDQSPTDIAFNNGLTFLSISGKKKKYSAYGSSGDIKAMWFQNWIHKQWFSYDIPIFKSTAPFKFVKVTYGK